MPIKAQFSAGKTEITVQSLHQWDYGQQIEIEADDIPESIIEVHFACQGMSEAIIHSCAIAGGKGIVPIPDRCLEQTRPITAWVYEIEKTDGVVTKCTTTKTITIPVVARTRPSRGEEIPQSVVDSCAELIAEVNEAIDKINSGEVVASHAKTANSAGYATTAGKANSADTATNDSYGDPIHQKYAWINYGYFEQVGKAIVDPGSIFVYQQYPTDEPSLGLAGVYRIGVTLSAGTWGLNGTFAKKYVAGEEDLLPADKEACVLGFIGRIDGMYNAYLIQVCGI